METQEEVIFCPYFLHVKFIQTLNFCLQFQKDYERVQNGPLPNHITGNSLISEIKDDPELFSVVCGLMVKLAGKLFFDFCETLDGNI